MRYRGPGRRGARDAASLGEALARRTQERRRSATASQNRPSGNVYPGAGTGVPADH